MRARLILPAGAALAGAGALAYASLVERNSFALRQAEVPVLAPGTAPIRVLHEASVTLRWKRGARRDPHYHGVHDAAQHEEHDGERQRAAEERTESHHHV